MRKLKLAASFVLLDALLFAFSLASFGQLGPIPTNGCGDEDYYSEIFTLTTEINATPNDVEAYLKRAEAYMGIYDHVNAMKDLKKVMALDPKNDEAYVMRGAILSNRGSKEGAIADFTKAIALNPENGAAYYWRGRERWNNLKESDLALADFSKKISIDRKHRAGYYGRGGTYMKLRRYDEAVVDFDNAIALLNAEIAEATREECASKLYIERGWAYYTSNREAAALIDFNRSVEIEPNYYQGYAYRGIIWYNQRNYTAALYDFDKAIELNPTVAGIYENRAWVYEKLGLKDKAAADRRKAFELKEVK